MKALGGAYAALGGESGVAVGAEECAALLESAAKFYPEAEEAAKTMRGLAYELSDCAAGVRDLAEGFEYNPERLSQIDERLDALYRISMKYGAREEDILAKLESLKKERAEIEISGELIAELEQELYALSDKIKILSARLTESRMKAAAEFEKRVAEELEFLDMPKVRFVVDRKPTALTSKGADSVEFLISANPGRSLGR